jgi:cell wall-associated NlpC family hydrolase
MVGNTYHCDTQSSAPANPPYIDWRLAQPRSNTADEVMQAYILGRQLAAERAAEAAARAAQAAADQAAADRAADEAANSRAEKRAADARAAEEAAASRAANWARESAVLGGPPLPTGLRLTPAQSSRFDMILTLANSGRCDLARQVALSDLGSGAEAIGMLRDTVCPKPN